MKNLIFLIILILSINLVAQNEFENTNIFVRVYDLQGKKISKGKILSISETSLSLNKNGESIEIPVSSIGSIKTKRSAGNNIIVGTASGAITMAIIGAATAQPEKSYIFSFTAEEGATEGALLGGITGAAIGGITILFKNSKTYIINGDKIKLKNLKKIVEVIILDKKHND